MILNRLKILKPFLTPYFCIKLKLRMQEENVNDIGKTFYNLLIARDRSETSAVYLNLIANILVLAIVIFILDKILQVVIIKGFKSFSDRTKTTFDDYLVKSNFPRYTAHIIPFILIEKAIPYVFTDFPGISRFLLHITDIYLIFLVIWIIRSILRSTRDFLKDQEAFRDKPLESYAQVIMIFVWFLGLIYLFSNLTGQPVLTFLTTLGAASAILLLIFKDTILGFVASIQVSVNDLVRIGDWITQEQYGADGDVVEINLTTVKVRNFDNTITTLPTYSLISNSFKNWRGMQESGGRRIKRSVIIASESIRFLSPEELETLKKITLVASYIDHRQQDINTHNEKNQVDKTLLINGRNQTNMGIFRKYIDAYISNHSAINKDMTLMVRQLEPTTQGLPLQIYAFSSDKRWANYEYIIADIFDHLLAAIPYFDLRIFELPTGSDVKTLKPLHNTQPENTPEE